MRATAQRDDQRGSRPGLSPSGPLDEVWDEVLARVHARSRIAHALLESSSAHQPRSGELVVRHTSSAVAARVCGSSIPALVADVLREITGTDWKVTYEHHPEAPEEPRPAKTVAKPAAPRSFRRARGGQPGPGSAKPAAPPQPQDDPELTRLLGTLPGHRLRNIVRTILLWAQFGIGPEHPEYPGHVESVPKRYGRLGADGPVVVTQYEVTRLLLVETGYAESVFLHNRTIPVRIDFPPTPEQIRRCLDEAALAPACSAGDTWGPCAPFVDRRIDKSKKSPGRRARDELVAELGELCHCCWTNHAVVLDHDHISNLVRGVLCHRCNTAVDRCLHAGGCRFADYLNNPPALKFHMRYRGDRDSKRNAELLWDAYIATPQGKAFFTATRDTR
ncbi:MAG: endonuclease domain-containing protein [Segniliparus sp.]|uniref:endonuclease domain-containing protein n=1 Tax=Segniliparus sp. TaxID=2804064 RepID=UPI003F35ACF5